MFRKDVAYDNIKSQEKAFFHPLSRKRIPVKTTGKSPTSYHPLACLGLRTFPIKGKSVFCNGTRSFRQLRF